VPIPVIVVLAVAAVLAFMRTPNYTAESQLTLGQLDVAAQTPSYVTAAQGLAATYARAIHAGPVTRGAAKAVHITPLEASARLEASPVPSTPLFLIAAKGHSAKEATKLANAASTSLVRYVNKLSVQAAAGGRALHQYESASASQHDWAIRAALAQQAYARNPSAANRRALSKATQRRDRAALRAQVLASVYGLAKRTDATSNVLQVLAPATSATSDRSSVIQKFLFGGAAIGIALGLALAVWEESRSIEKNKRLVRLTRAA
jgi:hypothetical protein